MAYVLEFFFGVVLPDDAVAWKLNTYKFIVERE